MQIIECENRQFDVKKKGPNDCHVLLSVHAKILLFMPLCVQGFINGRKPLNEFKPTSKLKATKIYSHLRYLTFMLTKSHN